MAMSQTEKLLEQVTDEGLFQRLATAVLRDADPRYRGLIHPGVNTEGKTVKSPVDAIAFVEAAVPPFFIINIMGKRDSAPGHHFFSF